METLSSIPILCLIGLIAVATGASAEATEADAEASAGALLRAATGPLERAESFRLKMRVAFDVVQEGGQKIEFGSNDEVMIRRPNRARARFEADNGTERHLYYDGESISIHYPTEKVYGQFPVPETLDATLDYLELDLGMPLPLADLLYSDLAALGAEAKRADVVGVSRVLEWSCDQLSFEGEHVDYQVWVERASTPLIRKVVINYKERPGSPQLRAVFLEWDLQAELSAQEFSFTAPPGTERVPTLARPLRTAEGSP
jgi:hypothetical protein